MGLSVAVHVAQMHTGRSGGRLRGCGHARTHVGVSAQTCALWPGWVHTCV